MYVTFRRVLNDNYKYLIVDFDRMHNRGKEKCRNLV